MNYFKFVNQQNKTTGNYTRRKLRENNKYRINPNNNLDKYFITDKSSVKIYKLVSVNDNELVYNYE